jgi:hypothetical protein
VELSILHIARVAASRATGYALGEAAAFAIAAAQAARTIVTGNHTVTVVPSRKRLSIFKLP